MNRCGLVGCFTAVVSCFVSAYAAYRPQQPAPEPYPPSPPPAEHNLVLSASNINPHCKPLFDQSLVGNAIANVLALLENGPQKNFDSLINLGLPYQPDRNGIKPLTFLRELLAAIVLQDSQSIVHNDAAARAKSILLKLPGHSIGSYSDPRGIPEIRQHVEEYLWKRDYVAANSSHILLTNGPVDAMRDISKLILNDIGGKRRGLLFPAPAFQFYREAAKCEGICTTLYRVDPKDDWRITKEVLQAALDEQSNYCTPTALFISDLNIATGTYLSREELEIIVKFACHNNLIIISDEIHGVEIALTPDAKRISVRVVAQELKRKLEIATIISGNYPYLSEAGIRNAAYELLNFDSDVVDAWVEVSRFLRRAPNTVGQLVIEVLANPPKPGDPSFGRWEKERATILGRIRKNAEIAIQKIEEIPGLSSSPVQAGFVMFIKVDLSDDFIDEADSLGLSPDVYYSIELIRRYGVVVVPGSWYNQPESSTYVLINLLNEPNETLIAFRRWEEYQNGILNSKPY